MITMEFIIIYVWMNMAYGMDKYNTYRQRVTCELCESACHTFTLCVCLILARIQLQLQLCDCYMISCVCVCFSSFFVFFCFFYERICKASAISFVNESCRRNAAHLNHKQHVLANLAAEEGRCLRFRCFARIDRINRLPL